MKTTTIFKFDRALDQIHPFVECWYAIVEQTTFILQCERLQKDIIEKIFTSPHLAYYLFD